MTAKACNSIFIKRPYISVVSAIQKNILGELAKGERSNNGFIDHYPICHAQYQLKARWSRNELPENTGTIGRTLSAPLLRLIVIR